MRPSKLQTLQSWALYMTFDECKLVDPWRVQTCTVSQDSAEGDVSFNITAFDLAGNSFAVDQTQLSLSNVIVDRF